MTHSKSTKKSINDADFLRQMVQTYLQEYLEKEMAVHLGVLPYERNATRRGYRNGYAQHPVDKPRQLNTRVGKLFLTVPQDRDGTFSTELFEPVSTE